MQNRLLSLLLGLVLNEPLIESGSWVEPAIKAAIESIIESTIESAIKSAIESAIVGLYHCRSFTLAVFYNTTDNTQNSSACATSEPQYLTP